MAAALPFIVAGVSAYGAIAQGQQQEQALKQQAATASKNSRLLEEQARTARIQAGMEEEAQRKEARRLIGSQSAAIGQAGIGFGGTPGLLQEDTALQAELDALNIRYGGEQQAKSLLNQAGSERDAAGILRSNAASARKQGLIGAGTSVLTSAGGMYGSGMGSSSATATNGARGFRAGITQGR